MTDEVAAYWQATDVDSESSDGVISLHSTESDERSLTSQADEAVSAHSDLQKLIYALSGTIWQAVGCYELKLYVTCVNCNTVGLFS